jgi:hypothetical protein
MSQNMTTKAVVRRDGWKVTLDTANEVAQVGLAIGFDFVGAGLDVLTTVMLLGMDEAAALEYLNRGSTWGVLARDE